MLFGFYFWFLFCGIMMLVNVFLYDKLAGKPKTVKGSIGRILAYVCGGIPLLQIAITMFYCILLVVNIIDDNNPKKWYNKPLK